MKNAKLIHIYSQNFHGSFPIFVTASLLDIFIIPLIGLLMLLWMLYRFHNLNNLAALKSRPFPYSFQIRAFLVVSLCFLYILMVIFSSATHFLLFDSDYPYAIVMAAFMSVVFFYKFC